MRTNTDQASTPAGWLESLERSKAEIASGQSVPLLPFLDRLRSAADRLEGDKTDDKNAEG